MAKLEEVFGVSAGQILSYVERAEVDSRFKDALLSDKEIVVYGSSKQGKTALVSKHLPYEDNILVSLTPRTELIDVYQTILAAAGVRIKTGTIDRSSSEASLSFGARVKALVPLFGSGEASLEGGAKGGHEKESTFEEVPINLELPQSVSTLLDRLGDTRFVILENFHYLTDEVQQQFAFDLRAFQELGLRFVILGVWREKNKMAQFNGDLLDRIIEVPVEPWNEADFRRVADKGAAELNIRIASKSIGGAIDASFASIGVFQELLKEMCSAAGVKETLTTLCEMTGDDCLNRAIAIKATDYAARHQRALDAIAAGNTTGGAKGELKPLFLPYYLVQVLLDRGYEGIASGMRRTTLHDAIKEIHHRGADVRASDISNLLGGLGKLQAAKSISPPIIDYDSQNRLLQVVDSTFYFFIKNANLEEIAGLIPNPLED